MPHRIRRHLSFANVASLSALVFAMGGTGYALSIPKNSVGSAQIKKNGVASSDIRANAVTGAKVKNGSLQAVDFAANQLPRGATGAAGATGATGATGPTGPAGVVGTAIVRRTDIALPAGAAVNTPGALTSAFATCSAGEKIIGGSVNVSDPTTAEVRISRPSIDNAGSGTVPDDGEAFGFWKGTGRTSTNVTGTMRVFAICAKP